MLYPDPIQVNNSAFDPIGNITHKDDAGDLRYTNPAKPFNLVQIDNQTAHINPNTLNVTYTDFDNVSQITEMGTNKQMDFIYGADYQRLKMNYSSAGVFQFTRYYAQNHDRQETSSGYKEWNYIMAPTGLCAVNYNNNGAQQLFYTLTDHLGSPVLLTNNAQGIVEEYAFDAWGRRRNPTNWTYTGISPPQYMIRGFTMHEHIDEFGFINMNARVYDPVIGRFVQPDKYVQAPNNVQNFNRYIYCLNNPLNYTDPSGNKSEDLFGAFNNFFGGVTHSQSMGGDWSFDPTGNANVLADIAFRYAKTQAKIHITIGSIALGALTGGVGASIGVTGFAGGAFWGFFTGAAVGGLTGAAKSYVDGGDVSEGAFKGAVWGGIIGGVTGGVAGGLDAVKNGRNFWTGEYSSTNFRVKGGIELTGKPVKQEDLNNFVEKHFSDRIDKMDFRPTAEINDAKVGGGSGRFAKTVSDNYYGPGQSHIYLKHRAFSSDKNLYIIFDHELTHAELYSNGIFGTWNRLFGYNEAIRLSEVSAWLGSHNTAIKVNSSLWEFLSYGALMKYFR